MSEVMRNNTPKDGLINSIIMMEWEMFHQVNNIGGTASCQRDMDTFYIMRYSQHNILSEETLQSWKQDLQQAEASGRNLMMEKYGYMMEFTDLTYYRNHLEAYLPKLTPEKADLIAQIIGLQLMSFEDFAAEYPLLAGSGRAVTSDEAGTSIRTYSIGELKTYSEETLRLYLADMTKNPRNVYDLKKTTVELYGYSSLEAAEASLRP